MTFLVAVCSVLLSVAAQFALKRGMSSAALQSATAAALDWRYLVTVLSNPHVLLGLALYGLGAIVWLGVLARWDVSKAYPLVGMGFLLTLAMGHVAGEQVSPPRLAGALLICVGVVLVSRS